MGQDTSHLFRRWIQSFLGQNVFLDEEKQRIYTEILDIRFEIGFDGKIHVRFPFDALEQKVHLAMKEEQIKQFIKDPFYVKPYGFLVPIYYLILLRLPNQCNKYLRFIKKMSKELMEFFLEERIKTLMIAKALKGK